MKTLIFITGNPHKVQEVGDVLKDFGIRVEQNPIEYAEDKESDMQEIALKASKEFADQLSKPVIVDDTGLYFKEYNNFPGALPKFVFNSIGYEGIFRLLDGKDKSAYFETVIGYCEPNKEPKIFSDQMEGEIINKVIGEEIDAMPYDRIFIPTGKDKTIVEMSIQEKNSFSQRGKAARKLGAYLQNK